eukprot:280312_1
MTTCKYVIFVFTVMSSILLYRIHHGSPHYFASCTLFGSNCPNIRDGGSVVNGNFINIQNVLKDFVQNGEDTASQISIFINNKCELNYYAVDSNRYPNYNETSLHTIYSSTKNVAAVLIAIAINNSWIKSYDDKIIDYWPQFPTKQQYIHLSRDNKTGQEILQFESIKDEKYITIADVLRHEAGLCKFWNHENDIYFNLSNKNVSTYNSSRKSIETSKLTFIYNTKNNGSMSFRCYHSLTRGIILNELFKIVEPKHRYMNQYFKEEMERHLQLNDPNFRAYFKGAENQQIYHIEQPNLIWLIYNFVIPWKTGITSHLPQSICFKYLSESICDPVGKFYPEKLQAYLDQRIDYSDTPEIEPDNQKSGSIFFENELAMEYMSASGVMNAYSMSKLLSKYLYDNDNKLKDNVIEDIMKYPQLSFDTGIGFEFNFTQGGFCYFMLDGDIAVYNWMGWGGSWFGFIPQYKAVIAYTITGVARFDHGFVRETILLNLIEKELKANFTHIICND